MRFKKTKKEILEIINVQSIPTNIEKYIDNNVYDKTFSNRGNVFYIENKRVYLKVANLNYLKEEYINTLYFNEMGLAPQVLEFVQDKQKDYLITKELVGENGISNNHLKNPEKLAYNFGKHLRMIHSMNLKEKPTTDRIKILLKQCSENVNNDKLDIDEFLHTYGFTPNQGLLMLDSLSNYYKNDVVIHGDYCLPNIIMNDYEFSGIIDMDSSGLGDRHYDICSALNSLNMNLKTKDYDNIFLDSYGRDMIDKGRMSFAKLLQILS
ncbi:MAG: phosphotransferase [Romboutsia sp.]